MLACRGSEPPAAQPPAEAEAKAEAAAPLPENVQQSLAQIVASAAKVSGDVQIRRAGGESWEPIAVGATLRVGDTVRTGERSFARVRFSDGRSLELDEQTAIAISLADEEENGRPGVVVAVEEGSVGGVLNGSGDSGAPLFIDTGDGTRARLVADSDSGDAAEFRVRRDRHKRTEIAVSKGRLRVSSRGKESQLSAGSAAALSNSGLGEVISMIAFPASTAPGVDARYHYQEGMSIELAWTAVDGAAGYRVQVARDLSFHELVAATESATTKFEFAPAAPGMYTWRVASRDSDERPGEYGFVRRIYCEVDTPEDLLVAPPDGARLAYAQKKPELAFSWQTSGNASSYRLVISRQRDPRDQPIVDQETKEQSIAVDSLGEGSYSWGVYAVGDVVQPLFLRPRRLVIERRKAPQADTKDLWD